MRFEVFTFRSPEGQPPEFTAEKLTRLTARRSFPGWEPVPESIEVREFPLYSEMWEEHHGPGSWPTELARREAEEAATRLKRRGRKGAR